MVGVPLPLCSCSVIPTAVTLKKKGATNAATSAFLISTPETGVDSMIITYAMMDLPMTIIRPVAAFFTAMIAGLLNYFFNSNTITVNESEEGDCCNHCHHDHEHENEHAEGHERIHYPQFNLLKKFYRYVFIELLDDFAVWVTVGIFLGAAIDFWLPLNLLQSFNGIGGKLLMIVIGIPLYICASSTTPIAASLVIKGMSPGTALILLLTGPATNISTLVVMQKYIGKKGVILNAIAIALTSLVISYIVDFLYSYFSWPIHFNVLNVSEDNYFAGWNNYLSIILIILLAKGLYANFKEKAKS